MNWIKDIIPNIKRNLSQTFGEDRQSKVPEGLWRSCENCGAILYIPELKKSSYVCSKCGHHFKIDVSERIEVTFDEGSYKSLNFFFLPIKYFQTILPFKTPSCFFKEIWLLLRLAAVLKNALKK